MLIERWGADECLVTITISLHHQLRCLLRQVARQERSVRERVRGVVEGFMKGEPNEEEARVMAQGRKVRDEVWGCGIARDTLSLLH